MITIKRHEKRPPARAIRGEKVHTGGQQAPLQWLHVFSSLPASDPTAVRGAAPLVQTDAETHLRKRCNVTPWGARRVGLMTTVK